MNNKNYILYFFVTILFKLSDKMYVIAIPWLIYDLTQSSVSTGLMFFVQTLPLIFIAPVAGTLADRFSRKKLMVYSALVQGSLVLFIPLLHQFNLLQVGFLYLIGFLIASAGACFNVTNSTIIPQLFKKESLMRVNSLFQIIDTSSVLFGSIAAGILISGIGVYSLFFVLGIAYLPIVISLLLLSMLHSFSPNSKKTSWQSLKEGASYLWTHPILRSLTWLIFIVNIANGSLVSMLVFYSRDEIGVTSTELGWIYAGAGIAQFVGILLINVVKSSRNTLNAMVVVLFVSAIGIILTAFSWNWYSLMICISIQSAPVIVFNVLNKTFRQQIVPANLLGRVNGLVMMIGLASLPLSGFFVGLLSEVVNIRWIFLLLGILSLITVIQFRRIGNKRKINSSISESN
ncbi:MFS transporter [Alkalicoccobacillus gibsonii]|uniref:MFS transporter n=1 Tax=Alkalicoccobacillus gibsonii TaxID=79881 RepID=UPI0019315DA5|nr:MFS transporter [Alkalicoccobacillus gibsonii]MBM0064164.1 MFS transporter [Alkalicoccobacillus gibsonii]